MERTCPSCGYNTLSEVVSACPNCGKPLPGARLRGGFGGLVRALSTFIMFAIIGGIAFFAIRVLRSPNPEATLLDALPNPSPAATSPARPPRPAADVDALLRDLTARDAVRRRQAAQKLGTAGEARAVGPLLSTARDLTPAVRGAAMEALGRIASRQALRPDDRTRVEAALRGGLSDADATVRAAATGATAALERSRRRGAARTAPAR